MYASSSARIQAGQPVAPVRFFVRKDAVVSKLDVFPIIRYAYCHISGNFMPFGLCVSGSVPALGNVVLCHSCKRYVLESKAMETHFPSCECYYCETCVEKMPQSVSSRDCCPMCTGTCGCMTCTIEHHASATARGDVHLCDVCCLRTDSSDFARNVIMSANVNLATECCTQGAPWGIIRASCSALV